MERAYGGQRWWWGCGPAWSQRHARRGARRLATTVTRSNQQADSGGPERAPRSKQVTRKAVTGARIGGCWFSSGVRPLEGGGLKSGWQQQWQRARWHPIMRRSERPDDSIHTYLGEP